MRSDTIRGAHARTAEEIAQSDAEATAFFTQYRSEGAMRSLRREKYVAHLWEAVREGLAFKYQDKRTAAADARRAERAAVQALVEAAEAEARARAMASGFHVERPAGMPETALHIITAKERSAARQSAKAFFKGPWKVKRIARLQGERRVDLWAAERAVLLSVWRNAPVDPISWDEYAAIATKSIEVRRAAKEARRAAKDARTYRRRHITPVGGITPERADEIALAALKTIENGGTPTFR